MIPARASGARIQYPVLRYPPVPFMRKVPQITILFWVIKLLSTAMGNSTSGYLVYHINPYAAVIVGSAGLVASLLIQLFV